MDQGRLPSALRDGDLAGADAFVECEELGCVVRVRGYDREDGQVIVNDCGQYFVRGGVGWAAGHGWNREP